MKLDPAEPAHGQLRTDDTGDTLVYDAATKAWIVMVPSRDPLEWVAGVAAGLALIEH